MRGFTIHFAQQNNAYVARFKKLDNKWSTKNVPVAIDDEYNATKWFQPRYTYYLANGFFPVASPEQDTQAIVTIRTVFEAWITWLRTVETKRKSNKPLDPRTIDGYEYIGRTWILTDEIADHDLTNGLSIPLVIAFTGRVKRQCRAANTAKNVIGCARRMYDGLRKMGKVPIAAGNPFSDEMVKETVPRGERLCGNETIHLTAEEANQLITSKKHSIPIMRKVKYTLAVSSGMRSGEIAGLTFDDLHLDDKQPWLRIDRQFTQDRRIKEPKYGSKRSIPLHPLAVAALKFWLSEGWHDYVGRKPQSSDPVFPSVRTGKMVYGEQAARHFRADLKAAGLPEMYQGKHPQTFQATRRTFGTLADTAGVGTEHREALMGHTASTVGAKHYVSALVSPNPPVDVLTRYATELAKLPLADALPWL